jgi:hypothetical protein
VVRVGYTSDEVEAEVRRIEALVDHPGAFGVRENFPNDISVGKLDEPVHDVKPIVSSSFYVKFQSSYLHCSSHSLSRFEGDK